VTLIELLLTPFLPQTDSVCGYRKKLFMVTHHHYLKK